MTVVAPAPPRRDLRPSLDAASYAVARYPAGWRPSRVPDGFAVLVADADEVTLVAAEPFVRELDPPLALDAGWRRVTFAGPLPWEIVGFLADVAGRLAEAGVPFTSVSSFTTDHLLVRSAHADVAIAVLSGEPPPARRPGTTNP